MYEMWLLSNKTGVFTYGWGIRISILESLDRKSPKLKNWQEKSRISQPATLIHDGKNWPKNETQVLSLLFFREESQLFVYVQNSIVGFIAAIILAAEYCLQSSQI